MGVLSRSRSRFNVSSAPKREHLVDRASFCLDDGYEEKKREPREEKIFEVSLWVVGIEGLQRLPHEVVVLADATHNGLLMG